MNPPIRGQTFVTRKITRDLARIHEGLESHLHLGNLESLRDSGHARDYVRAQWLMLQHDKPDDFVIAKGEQHSVREFVKRPGAILGMRFQWHGDGVNEEGVDTRTGRIVVKIDPRYFRPTEVETLLGDATNAWTQRGGQPEVSLDDLVKDTVASDLDGARRDAVIAREGFKTLRYQE